MGGEAPQSKTAEGPPRDEKGRILKGHSGNPGGLSKWQRKLVKALETKAAPLAAKLLVDVLENVSEDMALRLKAADITLKHVAPRPPQRVELTGKVEGTPNPLANMTPEQLLALVKGAK